MADIEDEADIPAILLPCATCNRTFKPQSLEKHTKVCAKAAAKKRKTFDSSKQRIQGTELAEFLPTLAIINRNREKQQAKKVPSKWKERHMELVRAVRAARGIEVSPRPAGSASKLCDHEKCPHCDRQFGPKAYDRHIEWCKEQKARIPKSPSSSKAKERLEARLKYRAPALMKSRPMLIRDKYSSAANLLKSGPPATATPATPSEQQPQKSPVAAEKTPNRPHEVVRQASKPTLQRNASISGPRSSMRQRSISPVKRVSTQAAKTASSPKSEAIPQIRKGKDAKLKDLVSPNSNSTRQKVNASVSTPQPHPSTPKSKGDDIQEKRNAAASLKPPPSQITRKLPNATANGEGDAADVSNPTNAALSMSERFRGSISVTNCVSHSGDHHHGADFSSSGVLAKVEPDGGASSHVSLIPTKFNLSRKAIQLNEVSVNADVPEMKVSRINMPGKAPPQLVTWKQIASLPKLPNVADDSDQESDHDGGSTRFNRTYAVDSLSVDSIEAQSTCYEGSTVESARGFEVGTEGSQTASSLVRGLSSDSLCDGYEGNVPENPDSLEEADARAGGGGNEVDDGPTFTWPVTSSNRGATKPYTAFDIDACAFKTEEISDSSTPVKDELDFEAQKMGVKTVEGSGVRTDSSSTENAVFDTGSSAHFQLAYDQSVSGEDDESRHHVPTFGNCLDGTERCPNDGAPHPSHDESASENNRDGREEVTNQHRIPDDSQHGSAVRKCADRAECCRSSEVATFASGSPVAGKYLDWTECCPNNEAPHSSSDECAGKNSSEGRGEVANHHTTDDGQPGSAVRKRADGTERCQSGEVVTFPSDSTTNAVGKSSRWCVKGEEGDVDYCRDTSSDNQHGPAIGKCPEGTERCPNNEAPHSSRDESEGKNSWEGIGEGEDTNHHPTSGESQRGSLVRKCAHGAECCRSGEVATFPSESTNAGKSIRGVISEGGDADHSRTFGESGQRGPAVGLERYPENEVPYSSLDKSAKENSMEAREGRGEEGANHHHRTSGESQRGSAVRKCADGTEYFQSSEGVTFPSDGTNAGKRTRGVVKEGDVKHRTSDDSQHGPAVGKCLDETERCRYIEAHYSSRDEIAEDNIRNVTGGREENANHHHRITDDGQRGPAVKKCADGTERCQSSKVNFLSDGGTNAGKSGRGAVKGEDGVADHRHISDESQRGAAMRECADGSESYPISEVTFPSDCTYTGEKSSGVKGEEEGVNHQHRTFCEGQCGPTVGKCADLTERCESGELVTFHSDSTTNATGKSSVAKGEEEHGDHHRTSGESQRSPAVKKCTDRKGGEEDANHHCTSGESRRGSTGRKCMDGTECCRYKITFPSDAANVGKISNDPKEEEGNTDHHCISGESQRGSTVGSRQEGIEYYRSSSSEVTHLSHNKDAGRREVTGGEEEGVNLCHISESQLQHKEARGKENRSDAQFKVAQADSEEEEDNEDASSKSGNSSRRSQHQKGKLDKLEPILRCKKQKLKSRKVAKGGCCCCKVYGHLVEDLTLDEIAKDAWTSGGLVGSSSRGSEFNLNDLESRTEGQLKSTLVDADPNLRAEEEDDGCGFEDCDGTACELYIIRKCGLDEVTDNSLPIDSDGELLLSEGVSNEGSISSSENQGPSCSSYSCTKFGDDLGTGYKCVYGGCNEECDYSAAEGTVTDCVELADRRAKCLDGSKPVVTPACENAVVSNSRDIEPNCPQSSVGGGVRVSEPGVAETCEKFHEEEEEEGEQYVDACIRKRPWETCSDLETSLNDSAAAKLAENADRNAVSSRFTPTAGVCGILDEGAREFPTYRNGLSGSGPKCSDTADGSVTLKPSPGVCSAFYEDAGHVTTANGLSTTNRRCLNYSETTFTEEADEYTEDGASTTSSGVCGNIDEEVRDFAGTSCGSVTLKPSKCLCPVGHLGHVTTEKGFATTSSSRGLNDSAEMAEDGASAPSAGARDILDGDEEEVIDQRRAETRSVAGKDENVAGKDEAAQHVVATEECRSDPHKKVLSNSEKGKVKENIRPVLGETGIDLGSSENVAGLGETAAAEGREPAPTKSGTAKGKKGKSQKNGVIKLKVKKRQPCTAEKLSRVAGNSKDVGNCADGQNSFLNMGKGSNPERFHRAPNPTAEFHKVKSSVVRRSLRNLDLKSVNQLNDLIGRELKLPTIVSNPEKDAGDTKTSKFAAGQFLPDIGVLTPQEGTLSKIPRPFFKTMKVHRLPSMDTSLVNFSSLSRRSPHQTMVDREGNDMEQRYPTICSSGSESSLPPIGVGQREKNEDAATEPAQLSKLSKFCHECGSKYPVNLAKFCCECGVRRLFV